VRKNGEYFDSIFDRTPLVTVAPVESFTRRGGGRGPAAEARFGSNWVYHSGPGLPKKKKGRKKGERSAGGTPTPLFVNPCIVEREQNCVTQPRVVRHFQVKKRRGREEEGTGQGLAYDAFMTIFVVRMRSKKKRKKGGGRREKHATL